MAYFPVSTAQFGFTCDEQYCKGPWKQGMSWLWSCRQEGGLCMEKHADGFRPMKTEVFYVCAPCIAPTTQCSAQCCDVLSRMWAVLRWISTPSLLFVLHMCGLIARCAFVQHRPRT